MKKFPKNILVILSHLSYWVPDKLKENLNDSMKMYDCRLLKNFSDWWTKFLISEEIPKNQIIEVNFSRAIWDPNRSRNALDIFRDTDFWWIKIWKTPLTDIQKEELLIKYYDIHHSLIEQRINEIKKNNKKIFIIDMHDTWNLLMWEDFSKDKLKEKLFPKLALCDSKWKTLPLDLKEFVERSFLNNLDIWVVWNDPYEYSFTSSNYCDKENWIYSIQVEFWRYLLIDEQNQVYNPWVEKLKNWLCKALIEIWNYLK